MWMSIYLPHSELKEDSSKPDWKKTMSVTKSTCGLSIYLSHSELQENFSKAD